VRYSQVGIVVALAMVLPPNSAVEPPGFSLLVAPVYAQDQGDSDLGRLGAIETVAPLCLQPNPAARAVLIVNVRSKVVR
jgi:hypothetical protein